jgi:hypothetical protein
MASHLYKEFEDSGRMQQTREWIDNPKCPPNYSRLLSELMAIIDLQHHVIMTDDELQTEYKEMNRV